MFLDSFHADEAGAIRISAAQGSAFAKDVAGDFNPIHDADNPRFCVPGDLLFALVMAQNGVASRMELRFTGMVGADVPVAFIARDDGVTVIDAVGKSCLEVASSGPVSRDRSLVESLVRSYVAFSGQNFPHILVPLMETQAVMINPDRPLVIYERMSFELDRLDREQLDVTLVDSQLNVTGRRGEARLEFQLSANAEPVGRGAKTLLLSGLRAHNTAALQGLVERYEQRKAEYLAASQVV